MEKKIALFLEENHLLSLATCRNDQAYAANCFYVWDGEECALLFASSKESKHMQDILHNPKVAGTIAPMQIDIKKLQGVQFLGIVEKATKRQQSLYTKKYPIVKVIGEPIWALELEWVKMTDNSLGFKKKIVWKRA